MTRAWLRTPIAVLLTFATAGLIAVGCALPQVVPLSVGVRSLGRGEEWLPLARWVLPDGSRLRCAGGGTIGDFRGHGSPRDPRRAWMIEPYGRRVEIAFGPGWSARFVPRLELVDPTGAVAAREGTRISGICGTAGPGVDQVEFDPVS